MDQPVIRQQSQAGLAWTLCHSRDLPGKHNKLLHTVTQRKGRICIVDFLKKLEYTNKRSEKRGTGR